MIVFSDEGIIYYGKKIIVAYLLSTVIVFQDRGHTAQVENKQRATAV